jgi:hypothetical protein
MATKNTTKKTVKKKPDWTSIRAEYIAGNGGYKNLAKKYGISWYAIAKKGKVENWVAKKVEKSRKKSIQIADSINELRQDAIKKEVQNSIKMGLDIRNKAINLLKNGLKLDAKGRIYLDIKDVKDFKTIAEAVTVGENMFRKAAGIDELNIKVSQGQKNALEAVLEGMTEEELKNIDNDPSLPEDI